MPLTEEQLQVITALDWLISPDEQHMRSGRSFVVAVAYVRLACRRPGTRIQINGVASPNPSAHDELDVVRQYIQQLVASDPRLSPNVTWWPDSFRIRGPHPIEWMPPERAFSQMDPDFITRGVEPGDVWTDMAEEPFTTQPITGFNLAGVSGPQDALRQASETEDVVAPIPGETPVERHPRVAEARPPQPFMEASNVVSPVPAMPALRNRAVQRAAVDRTRRHLGLGSPLVEQARNRPPSPPLATRQNKPAPEPMSSWERILLDD